MEEGCASYCSTVMIKYHGQGNLWKAEYLLTHSPKGMSPLWPGGGGTCL